MPHVKMPMLHDTGHPQKVVKSKGILPTMAIYCPDSVDWTSRGNYQVVSVGSLGTVNDYLKMQSMGTNKKAVG